MMEVLGQSPAMAFGQQVFSWARFVPSGATSQTLLDQFGIKSITRSVAGRWVVTLAEKSPGFVAFVGGVENDTTNLHDIRVEAYDYSAGTFTFVHRTAAFGSLGSLALSDTVDEIWLMVIARKAT